MFAVGQISSVRRERSAEFLLGASLVAFGFIGLMITAVLWLTDPANM